MPVVFVHGVNTRSDDEGYDDRVEARNKLIRRLLLEPLGSGFSSMEIVEAYWGDKGVNFAWNLASVPSAGPLDVMGVEDSDLEEGELVFVATVDALSGAHTVSDPDAREDGVLREAAESDLTLFLESIAAPGQLSEDRLSSGDAAEEGAYQAALAIALDAVANDEDAHAAAAGATSDDELMATLSERVAAEFESLVKADEPQEGLESYGLLDEARDHIGELFTRARSAPARAPSVAALTLWRSGLHERLSRFIGDIFVYLNERGDAKKPGPIVEAVRGAIERAAKEGSAGEPVIVITHSMGGNIVYDLLTYFAPGLKIDFWASVGGQVAQFEEMKLFRASDRKVRTPKHARAPVKPPLRYWLNIYDPADVFGFMARPVFGDIVDDDLPYSTGAGGMKAHGDYFLRASFYRLVREHLQAAQL